MMLNFLWLSEQAQTFLKVYSEDAGVMVTVYKGEGRIYMYIYLFSIC